jgi:hypothetical protein
LSIWFESIYFAKGLKSKRLFKNSSSSVSSLTLLGFFLGTGGQVFSFKKGSISMIESE